MYNQMAPVVKSHIDSFENDQMQRAVPQMDEKLAQLVKKGRVRKAKRLMTRFCVETAQRQLRDWVKLDEMMLVKFIDGNVKAQNEDGSFKHSEYNAGTPAELSQPGYTERWKAAVARDNGEVLEVK